MSLFNGVCWWYTTSTKSGEHGESWRQGKHFEIEINENDKDIAEKKINEMCKKLLVNLIIEDYKVNLISWNHL